jgi:hypothetical protein
MRFGSSIFTFGRLIRRRLANVAASHNAKPLEFTSASERRATPICVWAETSTEQTACVRKFFRDGSPTRDFNP